MNTLEQIKSNETYKQVLKDSYGGIMYDVANRSKYDTTELMQLWSDMPATEKELAGGIMKGAINFLKGDE